MKISAKILENIYGVLSAIFRVVFIILLIAGFFALLNGLNPEWGRKLPYSFLLYFGGLGVSLFGRELTNAYAKHWEKIGDKS